MNRTILIRITQPNLAKVGTDKEVYRNTVSFDPNISFPYEKFLEVFSMIYNKPGTIIHFSNFVQ